jgi:predicted Rossmann fold flavoprotein
MLRDFDVIVLGGGAAGLMCAIEAGKRGRRVAVLERAERIGKKILISGGGRCNFTNLHCHPENFISANSHFCKSALARYTPADFVALVQKHSIAYHEKKLGQLFCDGSAREIVAMLEREAADAGVIIFTNTKIAEVRRSDEFQVNAGEEVFRAAKVVVATGGLSIPKMGATSFGYELARQFGLKIQPCRPALVPLLWGAEDRPKYSDLAGISTEVVLSADSQSFHEAMLFTHRGVSGPAILQASSYWRMGQPITVDLAPDLNPFSSIRASTSHRDLAAAKSALRTVLPSRFADRWLDLNTPKRFTNTAFDELTSHLHRWTITPSGSEGYEKAEVTAGGIDTDELSAKTMESRKIPGLYFIGEVVDVTGHLGGFNFQWAWASGYAAGRSV